MWMLILPSGKDKTDIKLAPIQPHSKKADAPELLCKTLPDGKDGREIPTPEELFKLLENPEFQNAIDLIEKDMGCETLLKRTVRKQMKHDRLSDIAIKTQMRAIDLANSKQAGIKAGTF